MRPRDLLTQAAFENGIACAASTGGSTNVVLHLLALAREAGVELSIDDFDRVSEATPLIGDLRPGGRYVALDMDRAGGTPLLARRLLEHGKLHGDELTVTGRTIAEECADAEEATGQEVILPVERALKETGGAGDSEWLARAAGLRGEGGGLRAAVAARAGAGLRAGGGCDGGGHGGGDCRGGHRGDSLRGAEGRSGDAGRCWV